MEHRLLLENNLILLLIILNIELVVCFFLNRMEGGCFKFFITFVCHLKHHAKHNSYKPVMVLLKQSDIIRVFGGEANDLPLHQRRPDGYVSELWWYVVEAFWFSHRSCFYICAHLQQSYLPPHFILLLLIIYSLQIHSFI